MTCKEKIFYLIYKQGINSTADVYAKQINVSLSCVYRALKKLEILGLISRFKKSGIKYKKVIAPTLFGYAEATF